LAEKRQRAKLPANSTKSVFSGQKYLLIKWLDT